MTDYFWADPQQASDRLTGCFIPYKDEIGHVAEINTRGEVPTAIMTLYPKRTAQLAALTDPGFFRFRKPCPVGWVNNFTQKTAYFVQRQGTRTTKHGLTGTNTKVSTFSDGDWRTRDQNINNIAPDEGYVQAYRKDFPPLNDVLAILQPGGTIAIANDLAVTMDKLGVRWLFRNRTKVGIFTGADSLLLLNKFSYLKEELFDSRELTVNNIREF